jgi:flagellar hook assembly protein FlgD
MAELEVLDIYGRRVRHLLSESLAEGPHRVMWDGRNDQGERVASGIYICHLRAAEGSATAKMIRAR